MFMVSEKKKAVLKDISADIEKYPVVGIVDMHCLPARQLYQIKEQLKDKAVIRMAKKKVIMLALKQSKKPDIDKLEEKIQNEPAMLFSDANPFELAHTIARSVSKAAAKEGDIAPSDITIPAGPTNLPPGPAIGELQRIKIPSGVEGDKIVVKKDTCVAEEGETFSKDVADVLMKLGIEPMDISLNLVAVWDDGLVFDKDLLFIPAEHYIGQLKSGHSNAFNLSMSIDYITADTVPTLISKAYQQAVSLSLEAGIVTSENIGSLLAKAHGQATALKGMAKDEAPQVPQDESKDSGAEPEDAGKDEKEEKPAEGDIPEEAGEEKGKGKESGEEDKTEDSAEGGEEKDVGEKEESKEDENKEKEE